MPLNDPSFQLFNERQVRLLDRLQSATTEELYEKIIELGKGLSTLDASGRTEANRVQGCQSLMYLQTTVREGSLFIEVYSDALISKGLAAIAVELYNGLPLATIIKCSSNLAQTLKLESTLTPSRLGGFSSLMHRIQRDALLALAHAKS